MVEVMLVDVVIVYGGIDKVIVIVGVFIVEGSDLVKNDKVFEFSFGVNVKGGYIVVLEV